MRDIFMGLILFLIFINGWASSTEIQVEDMIGWLPLNTETLVVSQSPVTISTTQPKNLKGLCDYLPIRELLGVLEDLNSESIFGKKVLLYIEGSRKFRSPKQLGSMPYDGCHIYLMEDSAEEYMKLTQSVKRKFLYIPYKKLKIYSYRKKYEKDTWSLYIVSPRPNIVIIATHKGYLLEVLDRMNQPVKDRAFPKDLMEWNYVDTTSRFWGIRHYSKSNAKYDVTSPLTDYDNPDHEAIGFVFSYNPDKSPNMELRYISKNKNAIDITKKHWGIDWADLNPSIEKLDEYAKRITINPSTELHISYFYLLFWSKLGHAFFL